MPFAISGLIYIYAGIVIILVGFFLRQVYRETDYRISYRLFISAFGVGIGEFLFGLPMIIFDPASSIVRIGYILAWVPLFLGLNYTIAATLEISAVKKWKINLTIVILSLAVIAFTIGQFLNPPSPFLDKYGLIHWNVPFIFALLSVILLGIFAVYPGFVFASQKIKEIELKTKGIMLGLSYVLAALGGAGIVFFSNSLFDYTFLIFVSSVSYFLGFTLVTILFLFYSKILKNFYK